MYIHLIYNYYTLFWYRGGDCSTHLQKCQIFENFPKVGPTSRLSTGEVREPSGNYMKTQRGKQTSVPRSLENPYTWWTQTHSLLINLKCQWVPIYKTQVTNAIKITYPMKSQHITLKWLCYMITGLSVTKSRIATIIRHEKWMAMQNRWHLQAFSIIEIEVIKLSSFFLLVTLVYISFYVTVSQLNGTCTLRVLVIYLYQL